jgi:uncharacterized protein
MSQSHASVAPVTRAARVESLDILRGVAVFGILMMNITAFGLLNQSYDNPTVQGGATGINLLAYKIINVGFEGTMRGIFSILFGAGIVLLTERMERAGAGIMAAEVHFRRMLWMMLAGVIHWTLLLWFGEILFAYSLCGMLLFALRKLPVRVHLMMAAALLAGSVAMNYARSQSVIEAQSAATAAQAAKAAGTTLTAKQEEAIKAWEEEVGHITPTAEDAKGQRDAHSGSYWNAVQLQFPGSFAFQWINAPYWLFFDMIPFMLIGMALLKLGVLGAERSTRTYLMMMLGGYAVGIALGMRELGIVLASNFTLPGYAEAGETYQFSRLAMVVGHLGLLLLVIRSGLVGWLQRGLAAVGQMALSNYLMQTLICTWLFYSFGPGLGLYGQLERHELYYVVFAIWVVELVWSPLWLARFRFGPFEWVWRSLTYWQRQPMRRDTNNAKVRSAQAAA